MPFSTTYNAESATANLKILFNRIKNEEPLNLGELDKANLGKLLGASVDNNTAFSKILGDDNAYILDEFLTLMDSKGFSSEEKAAMILKQGLFIQACRSHYSSAMIPVLLSHMEKFSNELQRDILMQRDDGGHNCLMELMTSSRHHALIPTLNRISAVAGPKELAKMLTQKDAQGRGLLYHVTYRYVYHKDMLLTAAEFRALLHAVIEHENPAENLQDFLFEGMKGRDRDYNCPILIGDALKQVRWWSTSEADTMSQVILDTILSTDRLTLDFKYKMLAELRDLPMTRSYKALAVQCHHDLKTCLKELQKLNINNNELYQTLNTSLNEYTKNPSKENLTKFTTTWNNEINAARRTPAFKGRPDALSLLTTILLVVSVIGILYVGYLAKTNHTKGRSMFFPSTEELALNRLQDGAMQSDLEYLPKEPKAPDAASDDTSGAPTAGRK